MDAKTELAHFQLPQILQGFLCTLSPSLQASLPPREIIRGLETCLAGGWFFPPSVSSSLTALVLPVTF